MKNFPAPAPAASAADALEKSAEAFRRMRFTIGFDGFIDEILHAVDVRRSPSDYDRILTLPGFAERARAASGKSANIEMIPMQIKAGGNGPLMSLAVAGMGGRVTCVGLLGLPHVAAVFEPLREKAEVISLGNPGRTDALEFLDGKLMLGRLGTLRDASWPRLLEAVGADRLRALILEADLVACTNWTMITGMDEILENLIAMVPEKSPVRFFFDLADPQKRERRDLERALGQIRELNAKARCVLGLNLREAEQVGAVLGIAEAPVEESGSVRDAAERIAAAMNLHGVVVHAVRCAGACVDGRSAGIDGPYTGAPRLSTGAGDHFNGGFVSGLLSGLDVEGALYSAVGSSGWYVRQARTPDRANVIALLRDWAAGKNLD